LEVPMQLRHHHPPWAAHRASVGAFGVPRQDRKGSRGGAEGLWDGKKARTGPHRQRPHRGRPEVNFGLDASVTLAWAFEKECGEDPQAVLTGLETEEAVTTALWPLEISNGLLVAERRHRIDAASSARFLRLLLALPIVVDPVDRRRVFERTRPLAERLHLSAYNAHYLELAERYGIPLATLDRGLLEVAAAEGIRGFPV
jgi:predicted nucleic acid-binding protein